VSEGPARAIALACTGCVTFIGMDFHLAPVVIAIAAAFLVRVPLFKPKANLVAELSFTLLGMLGAFVTVVDRDLHVGLSFWCGICFGGVASSLLEVGKSMARSAWKDRVEAAGRVLFGLNGKAP
jgi:hypothetical protein